MMTEQFGGCGNDSFPLCCATNTCGHWGYITWTDFLQRMFKKRHYSFYSVVTSHSTVLLFLKLHRSSLDVCNLLPFLKTWSCVIVNFQRNGEA